jgi:hypothetical protein
VWLELSVLHLVVDFKPYSHEEAIAIDPMVGSLIQFAQNAALGAHTCILEDEGNS